MKAGQFYFTGGIFKLFLSSIIFLQQVDAQTSSYKFSGNGEWSNAANWDNGIVPPSTLAAGSQVIIEPSAGGKCILNKPLKVLKGAIFTVSGNSDFLLTNNNSALYPSDILDLTKWKWFE